MCTMEASIHAGVDSNAQHSCHANMGECIISTCMGFLGKTKDDWKARHDLTELCNRPSLWQMKGLKFLDGFAADLRRSVNMITWKLIGLKKHDYHIIMETLMPVMFWGYFYSGAKLFL
jgi:hypothetical protein